MNYEKCWISVNRSLPGQGTVILWGLIWQIVSCRSCSRHGAFTPCEIGTSAFRRMEGFILIHNCLFLIFFLYKLVQLFLVTPLCVALFCFPDLLEVYSGLPSWWQAETQFGFHARTAGVSLFSTSLSLSTEPWCFKYDFSIILFVCCSWGGGVGALDFQLSHL